MPASEARNLLLLPALFPRGAEDGVDTTYSSNRDWARIRRLERLAGLLDDRFRIPGTRFRFGWDGIVGLVPGIGDAAGAACASYIITEAARLGVPRGVVLRMLANMGIDALLGLVPVVGDLFDVGYKANRRNVNLLLRHLPH